MVRHTDYELRARYMASAVPLSTLVYEAFQHAEEQGKVDGGPPWAASEQYDITAKIEDFQLTGWDSLSYNQRMERVKPMLRQLLDERFHLKLHSEMRVTSVYALVQAKGGARLQPVDPPTNQKSFADQGEQDQTSDQKSPPPGGMKMTGNSWKGHAIRPAALTGQIRYDSHLDAMVIDETGLTGYYDFTMIIDRGKDAPLFQDQVEQQLGLKLIPKKVPIKTWVIDAAENLRRTENRARAGLRRNAPI